MIPEGSCDTEDWCW